MNRVYLLLGTLAFPFCVMAQNNEESKELDDVVISVNRSQSSLLRSSQQVKSVRKKQIEFANTRTSADLLSEFGSLSVQKSQGGGGSPQIRGFEASHILLMIDNVRMNTLIYRAGHLQNVITVNPFALDRMEILYGPSSVMYGSDALGGVINFYTPTPQLSHNNKLNIFGQSGYRYGSGSNESSANASFNIGNKKWASFTAVSFNHFGDMRCGKTSNPFMPKGDSYLYRNQLVSQEDGKDVIKTNNHLNHQQGSGYNQFDILEKVLFKPNVNAEHGLNVQFSTTSDINRYDRLTDIANGKPKFGEWYYGPQIRFMAAYDVQLKNKFHADINHLTVAYQRTQESRNNRKLNSNALGVRTENVHLATLTYDWIKYIHHHKIQAGLDANMNFLSSTAHTKDIYTGEKKPLDTRYPGGNNYMHNIDAFIQHSWHFSPKWYLNDGLRFGYSMLQAEFTDDKYYFALGKQHQNTPTYSATIGLNYVPQGWKFALNASTGFRVPNIDDMAKVFDSSAADNLVVVPNTNIKPEKTINLDLNVTKFFGDYVTWENIVYGTYIFDVISLEKTTLNGKSQIDYDGTMCDVYSNQNHQKGYIVGASSNLKANFLKNFSADMSVNYIYGRIVENGVTSPLDHIAPLYGRLGVGYHGDNKKWNVEFFALFNGKKPLKNYNMNGEDNIKSATKLGKDGKGIPAWYTLNLKANYNINKNWLVQAGVENIMDMEYRTFSSGINAVGRNIYVSAQMKF